MGRQAEGPLSKIDGVGVGDLAKQFGSPLFVFSEKSIRQRFQSLQNAFANRYVNVQFAWSYKTNYLMAVCAVMHQQGAIAEIVSQFEYEKAKSLGLRGQQIIFNGPHKPIQVLREVVADGVLIHVDHFGEIDDLIKVAEQLGQNVHVGLRLNMDVGLETSWSRFGFNLENGEAAQAVNRICQSKSLRFSGLHCHIGTSVVDADAYRKATSNLVKFGYQVRDEFGQLFQTIDIGGGFASSCQAKNAPATPKPTDDQYAEAICSQLADLLEPNHRPQLIIESGRALIDDAGYLITTVLANKQLADGTRACVIDAGVNLLHTAGTHHLNAQVAIQNAAAASAESPTTLFGPLCMDSDIVAQQVPLPEVNKGEHLVVSPVGAYNTSLWSQFIERRPNVVMIDTDGEVEIIREREAITDVQSRERLPKRYEPHSVQRPVP